jgi:predicted membrane channel-forming protein YqfA (hemolysin III family)
MQPVPESLSLQGHNNKFTKGEELANALSHLAGAFSA